MYRRRRVFVGFLMLALAGCIDSEADRGEQSSTTTAPATTSTTGATTTSRRQTTTTTKRVATTVRAAVTTVRQPQEHCYRLGEEDGTLPPGSAELRGLQVPPAMQRPFCWRGRVDAVYLKEGEWIPRGRLSIGNSGQNETCGELWHREGQEFPLHYAGDEIEFHGQPWRTSMGCVDLNLVDEVKVLRKRKPPDEGCDLMRTELDREQLREAGC